MAEVASERLNYLSKKQRAVSSRASRQIIPCSNGQTFTLGQTARIDLAGNQMATYWDAQNTYLKMTVRNNDGAVIHLESAYALIDRLEILADGQTVSNISNYGALVHQYLDSEVGQNWKGEFGRSLVGTSYQANELERIVANGGSSTFCLPLPFTPIFTSSKYIPMIGRSTISIRITFASAGKGTLGGATDNEVVISPIELVTSYIRLSAEANAMVLANTGGRFELICSDVRTAEGNLPIGSTVLNVNCGFSFSSLDRISFGFYPTLNTANALSVSNRSCGNLTEFALSINGEEHPRKRIQVSATNVSEVLAEIGVGSRSLADFNHQSTLTRYRIVGGAGADDPVVLHPKFYLEDPAGTSANANRHEYEARRGTFMAMIDTESMKPHADPDSLYSGLSTLGSVVQLVGTSAPTTVASTVLVFAQYTLALTLDMNGSQTWVVSI
jgi:hypothetical protein